MSLLLTAVGDNAVCVSPGCAHLTGTGIHTMGSHPDSSVVIEHRFISPTHAEIWYDPSVGEWKIRNFAQADTNGVFVSIEDDTMQKIEGERVLHDKDVFCLSPSNESVYFEVSFPDGKAP
jgi:hypothetical protein